MDEKQGQLEQDWLLSKAEVEERPFRSTAPFIGPLIVRLRTAWNNVATKWYVRPLLAQQNAYNRLVAERFADHDGRLLAQDQQQTQHTHDLAELTAQLIQLNRRLQSLEQRLIQLESSQPRAINSDQ